MCWDNGLNRTDPLQSWRCGVDTIGADVCVFRRLRTLDNCLKSGPVRVGFHPRRRHLVNGSYQFCLFSENFTIPRPVAELWELQNGSIVNVQWDIARDFHPHAFSSQATKGDDGRRLGIRVFATVRGVKHDHWIIRGTAAAVKVANTLYDLLTGKIVGKDYKWCESRKYIFQNPKHYLIQEKSLQILSEITEKRIIVGLPYSNPEFIWDDRMRIPESKPTEMVVQRDVWGRSRDKPLGILLTLTTPT